MATEVGEDGALMSGAVGCVGIVWVIVVFWMYMIRTAALSETSLNSPSRAAASWRREKAAGLAGMLSPVGSSGSAAVPSDGV
jgi:hypothetical protein